MVNAIKLTRVFNHYNRDMAAITLHTQTELGVTSYFVTKLCNILLLK